MNRLRKFAAAAVLTAGLIGGGQAAAVATAPPADALTWSSPWKHQDGGTDPWCPVFMRVTSVNFWDWLAGYRVGQIHLQYYAYC